MTQWETSLPWLQISLAPTPSLKEPCCCNNQKYPLQQQSQTSCRNTACEVSPNMYTFSHLFSVCWAVTGVTLYLPTPSWVCADNKPYAPSHICPCRCCLSLCESSGQFYTSAQLISNEPASTGDCCISGFSYNDRSKT